MDKWHIIELIIIIGLAIALCFAVRGCSKNEPVIETQTEYIEHTDTIKVPTVIIKNKEVIRYINKIDTFYVKVNDTIPGQSDTIYLEDIPIEYKEYIDTLKTDSTSTYVDIKYHGFNADIDNLEFQHTYYNKQTTVLKQKRTGWGIFIGPSVGYGINFKSAENIYAAPYLGVSVSVGWGYIFSRK